MFEIGDTSFEVPEDDRLGPEEGYEDERKWTLKEVLSRGMEILYVYDFGDYWRHLVTVEDAITPASAGYSPSCIAGARACPPEDCGGIYRYPEFLEALAYPAHPKHVEMVKWAHGFEPEPFSVAQANALIQVVCVLYCERGWGFEDMRTVLDW